MSNYQSLYRKWRPRDFSGIVGQRHIVKTLQKSIESDRISHAYLFCGPRGTGKTTTARVLAKAMNCEQGPTTQPCNKCPACKGIDRGNSLDVIEIDAASNRGIDEVRSLRDSARLAASAGRKKVYIIDEVHMLTTEAFNALLKLLEEPPGHVLFVLATTEAHKILQTIISRCQRFDFKPISMDDVKDRLKEISGHEKISVTDEALYAIARVSTGSLRDALSTLEQLSSFSDGKIDQETIDQVLGSTGLDLLLRSVEVINNGNAVEAIQFIGSLIKNGTNINQFTGDLIAHLRNLVLLSHGGNAIDPGLLVKCNETQIDELRNHSQAYDKERIMQWCLGISNAESLIKDAPDQRLKLETVFFELQRPQESPDALAERIAALENKVGVIGAGRAIAPPPPPMRPATTFTPDVSGSRKPEPSVETTQKPEIPIETPEPPQQKPSAAQQESPKEFVEPKAVSTTPADQKNNDEDLNEDQFEEKPPENKSTAANLQPLPEPQAKPSGKTGFNEKWDEILKKLKKESPTVFLLLAGSQPSLQNSELTLMFKPFASQHKERLEANMNILTDVVKLTFGKEITVKCAIEGGSPPVAEEKVPSIKIIEDGKAEPEDIIELLKEQFDAELIEEN